MHDAHNYNCIFLASNSKYSIIFYVDQSALHMYNNNDCHVFT